MPCPSPLHLCLSFQHLILPLIIVDLFRNISYVWPQVWRWVREDSSPHSWILEDDQEAGLETTVRAGQRLLGWFVLFVKTKQLTLSTTSTSLLEWRARPLGDVLVAQPHCGYQGNLGVSLVCVELVDVVLRPSQELHHLPIPPANWEAEQVVPAVEPVHLGQALLHL